MTHRNRKSAEAGHIHRVNFTIEREVFKEFQVAADANDRTVTHELRRLMRDRIAEHRAERQDQPA